jgi:hypothetical protein
MNKDNLTNFIQKYYLGNRVPSVMIKSNGKDLSCDFITADKSMLGNVKATGLGFGNEVVGVYDTETFLKMLSVMGDSIQLDVKKSGDKSVSITFTDGVAKSLFMLSDESVIPKVPHMKNVPEMKLKLKIDREFIQKFLLGKSALSEVDSCTVVCDNGSVNVVIGYSSIASNRVIIKTEVEEYSDVGNITFNAHVLKEILSANKACESSVLEVSSEGLARINFKIDEFDSTYYLVANQNDS